MDLNLSDALSDAAPQAHTEDVVKRDFIATLEAESYCDQVGETVDKTDYVPLLDKDEKQKDGEPSLEQEKKGNED